jgi:hypothetical protein
MQDENIVRKVAVHCEARKWSYRQTKDGVVISLLIHPQEVPDGIALSQLGTRYMVALVEINDQEEPVEQKKEMSSEIPSSSKKDWDSLSPSQQAGLLCKNPEFQKWIVAHVKWGTPGYGLPFYQPEEYVANLVRDNCEIESRSDLKNNPEAVKTWNEIVKDYWWHRDNKDRA